MSLYDTRKHEDTPERAWLQPCRKMAFPHPHPLSLWERGDHEVVGEGSCGTLETVPFRPPN